VHRFVLLSEKNVDHKRWTLRRWNEMRNGLSSSSEQEAISGAVPVNLTGMRYCLFLKCELLIKATGLRLCQVENIPEIKRTLYTEYFLIDFVLRKHMTRISLRNKLQLVLKCFLRRQAHAKLWLATIHFGFWYANFIYLKYSRGHKWLTGFSSRSKSCWHPC